MRFFTATALVPIVVSLAHAQPAPAPPTPADQTGYISALAQQRDAMQNLHGQVSAAYARALDELAARDTKIKALEEELAKLKAKVGESDTPAPQKKE